VERTRHTDPAQEAARPRSWGSSPPHPRGLEGRFGLLAELAGKGIGGLRGQDSSERHQSAGGVASIDELARGRQGRMPGARLRKDGRNARRHALGTRRLHEPEKQALPASCKPASNDRERGHPSCDDRLALAAPAAQPLSD